MSEVQIANVKVWEETREIPTYETGKPDKNPMFLEKRVYQGSSGRVYPYPVIDKIDDEKVMKSYQLVILENQYIRVELMPEIGGRIYRALDKTNDYDFVYYNRVIKPALVGLAGPWISGGIEFNWPQHHRPNTFGPVEYRMEKEEGGSAVLWISEIDRMYGTKMTAGFRLYPDKAYVEIDAQLYNRTSQDQTFLWWANPAVAVNDKTQSIFPPDVHAVFDHGKRDVSRFPIATGTYYKKDYSEGVDISRYKNIPVPTSYMAYKSDYNFVGGYDHGVQAGLLHVANHHISPGKKQWTWGNGEFGQAWDRQLTDEDGPYIELMTGVYTDNQPDFTWLKPYEEKAFTQYFMPYKNIGEVKNASKDAAVNLEIEGDNQAEIKVYTTSPFDKVQIELTGRKKTYLSEISSLSPTNTFSAKVALDEAEREHDLRLIVKTQESVLVAYQPKKEEIEEIPAPAEPMKEPKALQTTEDLYLAGLHLEQYRHATFNPADYYLEGLKREPRDSRLNIAYGKWLLRKGQFADAEGHFKKAIHAITVRNPNPYDGEAYFQLGLALQYQQQYDQAFAAFYKAVWSADWQDSGYFALAQIATIKGSYQEALELVNRSLIRNDHHYQARLLKIALLRRMGSRDQAISCAKETLERDKMALAVFHELAQLYRQTGEQQLADDTQTIFNQVMRADVTNYLALADDYQHAGLYTEAVELLETISEQRHPMVHYALCYLYQLLGKSDKSEQQHQFAKQAPSDYCFPNSLFDYQVLAFAIEQDHADSNAHYYIGNLLYDKKRYHDAIWHWEKSAKLDASFATVHRNLALAYVNKESKPEQAQQSLEKAFELNKQDARVFYELDQLYKKINKAPAERLNQLKAYRHLVEMRDDLYLEYVTLLNTLGQYEDALRALQIRKFHPWEGGEGKVTGQYVIANVELAKQSLENEQYQEAVDYLTQALHFPENLGEGKLEGAQENNIYYYLGCAYQHVEASEKAAEAFSIASTGLMEPASAMYYNDQPPEMIFYQGLAWLALNNEKEAKRRFHKLIDYGESHFYDQVKIDYFAVSLPDFLVFEEDLILRNKLHCQFMIGLGMLGLGDIQQAEYYFCNVLKENSNHQDALIHLNLCQQKGDSYHA
ncbi:DUF5107 domain-containing protein [Gracilibacillus salinarum]|uniref:DUF5107 domain-containing protein n=1 Tax=Gracilibacillus salinarum TaxID=2932255 RepID=A0ABY4GSP3_9BACI|nr:DUF5107 domain-containing protein [Gracilibacillus salinarum]UOQ87165.1 DUF5107 domain-containing protein [Gracilibacillus salinarum]